MEHIPNRLCRKKLDLQNRCRQWSKKYGHLKTTTERATSRLEKILNKDQLNALTRQNTQGKKWGLNTIRDALILKQKCGTTGYNELRARFPYPHCRTIQKMVQHLKFESGVLDEMLDLLEPVISTWNKKDTYFIASVDEMAIEPCEMVDPATQKVIGKATLGSHDGFETKAMTIVFGAVATRRKFIGGYVFTSSKKRGSDHKGDLNTGKAMWELLEKAINRAERIGLRIVLVTTDMGSDNEAMWKYLGIFAKRSGVKMFIKHPSRPDDMLWFMPDVPHLFKSANRMLLSNQIIRLPDFIVKEENLPSNIVDLPHVEELSNHESKFNLKVAPKLTEDALKNKNHFDKMRVSSATEVINERTSSGLQLLALEKQSDVYLTTAWFVALLNRWFVLTTNRSRRLALCKSNPEEYGKAHRNNGSRVPAYGGGQTTQESR